MISQIKTLDDIASIKYFDTTKLKRYVNSKYYFDLELLMNFYYAYNSFYNFLTFLCKDCFVLRCKSKGGVFKVQYLIAVNVVFVNNLRKFLSPISLLFIKRTLYFHFCCNSTSFFIVYGNQANAFSFIYWFLFSMKVFLKTKETD